VLYLHRVTYQSDPLLFLHLSYLFLLDIVLDRGETLRKSNSLVSCFQLQIFAVHYPLPVQVPNTVYYVLSLLLYTSEQAILFSLPLWTRA